MRIARIFNTYGPRMCIDDGRVVSNFVAQVILPVKSSCFTLLLRLTVRLIFYLPGPEEGAVDRLRRWQANQELPVRLRSGKPPSMIFARFKGVSSTEKVTDFFHAGRLKD